ncbi:MAG: hypothetical protein DRN27_07310 [Thermoplasmata archaeon]|nr:MAG: hypothetical protein DRN27_07310 [Thermoplasmata archaeon]
MDTENVNVDSNIENLELYSDNYPFRLSLRINNFENESSYKKFIKNCEMMIRRSIEYKLWRNYIIDVLQINECMITHESIHDLTIEVHHHLPSLFSLISALVNKHMDKNQEFCTFEICQEAIELHFKNKIGYVTLIKSMHEKFHNGKLTIPIGFVKGDYRYFVNEYSKYLDEDELEKIDLRLATNESNCTWSRDEYPNVSEEVYK